MATLNWPSGREFDPREFSFGVSVPKSRFGAFFSGQVQSVSHLAERLVATLTLPPCDGAAGARREAFFMEVMDRGHWLRLGHFQRPEPLGTLRGAPVLAAPAVRGATSIQVSTSPGATLLPGDPLGAASGQLLLTGYQGAVADGAGLMTVPLALPLRAVLALSTGLAWARPTATFELAGTSVDLAYGRGAWQRELQLSFREAY